MTLSQRLAEYVRACFTGLWIESHEHDDALAEIARLCRAENWRLAKWDIDQGLSVAGQEADDSRPRSACGHSRAWCSGRPQGTALLVLDNSTGFSTRPKSCRHLSARSPPANRTGPFCVMLCSRCADPGRAGEALRLSWSTSCPDGNQLEASPEGLLQNRAICRTEPIWSGA